MNNSTSLTGGSFTLPGGLDNSVPGPCDDTILDTPWLQHLKTEPLSNDIALGVVGVHD